MGDFVYAISSAGITATNLTTLEESDRVNFPQSTAYDRYAHDDAIAESEGEEWDEERDEEREEERNEERDGEGGRPTGDDSEGSSSSEPSRD